MNVFVNLLPEAKLHKLRIQAKRRRYSTIAGLTGGIVAAILIVLAMLQVFLLSTYAINQTQMNSLKNEISKSKEMEQSASTLQQNLNSFYELNEDRTFASRIFTNLEKATPDNITISSFKITSKDLVTLNGSAGSFAEVAAFAKSLEEYNVNYLPQEGLDRKPIFTEVTIVSTSKDSSSNNVNYSITFKTDKELLKKQKGEK